jgi:hypothetical protein
VCEKEVHTTQRNGALFRLRPHSQLCRIFRNKPAEICCSVHRLLLESVDPKVASFLYREGNMKK